MEKYSFDAIIIGSGCAGLNCADTLYDLGYKNIAIVTENLYSGTSRNTGSDKQTYYKISLSGKEDDSIEKMAETLFNGGCVDGDVALCEAANSARAFFKLVSLGVDFPTNDFGEYVSYKTDHDPFMRATSVGPYTSKLMTEKLEKSVLSKNIMILDHLYAVRIITESNRAVGLICFDNDGEYVIIKCPNIVLATGGPASIYYDSVYPESQFGSASLGWLAGAEFCNMSEWQFGLSSVDFRWNVSGSYQQVLPRYISIDKNGLVKEFLSESLSDRQILDYTFLKGYQWPFDSKKINGSSMIDYLVFRESVINGNDVYLDYSKNPSCLKDDFNLLSDECYSYLKNSGALQKTPIERLKVLNPLAIDLYKSHGIDLSKDLLKVSVCVQHNNGGINVNANWESSVKGLYSCGESAGTFGIYRPGGSALNSTQVGSLRVAQSIVNSKNNRNNLVKDGIFDYAIHDIDNLICNTHSCTSTLNLLRNKYQKRMSKYFSFIRNIESMKFALSEIEKDLNNFIIDNKWNKKEEIIDLLRNHDILITQYFVAKSMVYIAEKYGSRGSSIVYDSINNEPVFKSDNGNVNKLIVRKGNSDIEIYEREVNEIPDRDLWFESVWNSRK